MTVSTNSQPPFICDTDIERDWVLTTYPSLPESTMIYVTGTGKLYMKLSGAWVQKEPDATMQTVIDGMIITMAAKADASAMSSALSSKADSSAVTASLALKVDTVAGKALSANDFTNALLTKLNGIEAGATKVTVYSGTAVKATPGLYSASGTVSGGTVVFHLTDTGLAGGNALFPNGPITSSANAFVSDAAASYQMACVWSNSNKTVTITANKLTTANILTGVLGQANANTAVVNFTVWGN